MTKKIFAGQAAFLMTMLLLLGAFAGIAESQQPRTTVRGQILHMGPDGRWYPAPGLAVTLYSRTFGQSLPAYTGPDGMYYIYNVALGDYTLEVWVRRDSPLIYRIAVWNMPYNDIRPIELP